MTASSGSHDISNVVRTSQPIMIPSLSVEEEDTIIHTRITNDERPLRRIMKKFHNYTSVAHAPTVPPLTPQSNGSGNGDTNPVEDAREAFLVELASFQLSMKKSVMICEAEARQVEEYQRERQRIEDEHGKLRGQIDQLKTALEHAQVLRRHKIEYDVVAEKINTLPSREELEKSIQSLENDMATIRIEHDTQNRTIQGQKSALDIIISDLGSLRFTGKDRDPTVSRPASPMMTPAPEGNFEVAEGTIDGEIVNASGDMASSPAVNGSGENGEIDEREDEKASSDDISLSAMNLAAKPIVSAGLNVNEEAEEDDIEMGEVAEDPKNFKGKKKAREDLEEGEASDSSSALSDPPDD